MRWDDVLLTYEQAMKITNVLVWAGKQKDSPVTLEEAKELARHLYYRSNTKSKKEAQTGVAYAKTDKLINLLKSFCYYKSRGKGNT